jgi:hypothetical protein
LTSSTFTTYDKPITKMNNENVDAVLPQSEQEEYTLREMLEILDRHWELLQGR